MNLTPTELPHYKPVSSKKSMKVSVVTITYNQAKFIEQTVVSAATQKTNFPFEIIVGDDASTDETPDILRKLKKRFPDKIKLILNKRNLGGHGKNNFVNSYQFAKGGYIALLDGDDYWTSENKLQQQADLLDKHQDISICYHRVTSVNDEGQPHIEQLKPTEQTHFTIKDLLIENFIPTVSIMYRKKLFDEFPDFYFDEIVPDWILNILNAEHGNIAQIPQVMAAYRRHENGISAANQGIHLLECELNSRRFLESYLSEELKPFNKIGYARTYLELSKAYLRAKNQEEAKIYFSKCLGHSPLKAQIAVKELLQYFLATYSPTSWKILANVRNYLRKEIRA